MRCRIDAVVASRAAAHQPARSAWSSDGSLGHWSHDWADCRPCAWRLVDRQLQLALGVLHQPAGRRERFDFFGFAALGVAIGALQMLLDRGELKDWFHSTEIWIEATIAGLALYLFVVHTVTTREPPFLNRDLLRDRNFVAGNVLMFFVGVIMFATLALLPTMLQQSMDYPVATAGLVTAPRGIGTMLAMFLVGRIINLVDVRLLILSGLALTTLSLYQMSGFSLAMDMQPIVVSGLVQGFGLGFVFVPLSTISFATLPRSVLTQGTAIFSLTRNIGSSIGIAILEASFVENTQIVHSRSSSSCVRTTRWPRRPTCCRPTASARLPASQHSMPRSRGRHRWSPISTTSNR
jgi:MFS transporter, DHA2 family, multidrug resistance protein